MVPTAPCMPRVQSAAEYLPGSLLLPMPFAQPPSLAVALELHHRQQLPAPRRLLDDLAADSHATEDVPAALLQSLANGGFVAGNFPPGKGPPECCCCWLTCTPA